MELKNKSLTFFFALFFLVSLVCAADSLDNLANSVEDLSNNISQTGENIESFTKEDAKWEYIGSQLQETFLKNRFISFIDAIFKKGNLIFLILFGMDYSFSFTLFLLILVWIYFLSQFEKILRTFSGFSQLTSSAISLGLVIILAQSNFFVLISNLLFKLLFYREGKWGIIWVLGTLLFVILASLTLSSFLSSFKRSYRKIMEEREKKERELGEKFHYEVIKTISEAMLNAFKEK